MTNTEIKLAPMAGEGGAYTNTVGVAGQSPFTFQWYTNGIAIAGATGSNLILNPVTVSDSLTNYYVVINNSYGSVTSSVVSLTVVSNIVFVAQFPVTYTNTMTLYGGDTVGGTNYFGSSPTFSVSALGATPISYQWKTNGVAVGGATGTSFAMTDCQFTSSPTNIECVLANSFGSVTSEVWSVAYTPAPMAPFPQAVLAAQPIGYWRLNDQPDNGDGDQGAICTEYQSGNNGIYTNVYLDDASPLGGTGYDPTTDPNEVSALFGIFATSGSFAGNIGTNIDFSLPSGNAEYTVAIWANGNSVVQPANGGLVTKGYFYGEEMNIDNGGPVNSAGHNTLRFEARDAIGGDHDVDTTIDMSADSNWHLIVAVCDEANGLISLYKDGSLVGSAAMPVGGGIVNSASAPLMIGARSTSATSEGNNQFIGYLNDLAIYNYAFTAEQVQAMYDVAGVAPSYVQEPVAGTNIDAGATLSIPVTVVGSLPLSYQWYDSGGALPGQTNATLVVSNDVASDNYYLIVQNQYGSAQSSGVGVNVFSGAPQIYANVQTPFVALAGQTASNSAVVYGSYPLSFQWQFSNNGSTWVNLTNNSQISGAQANAISIGNVQAANVGDYQLVVTNVYGSVTSSVAPLMISGVLPLSFYNGLGWTIGTGSKFSDGVLTLTYGTTGNSTYFYDAPQYVGAFQASFIYQAQYDSTFPLADGITFCLQDDPRGVKATGSGGGDLGYNSITPSVAFQINIYPGNGFGGFAGIGLGLDGNLETLVSPGSVNLTNGMINVWLNYSKGNLAVTLSNELSAATFSTTFVTGDITEALGSDTAYVGFTGAFGGDTSVQTIQDFQFEGIPSQSIDVNYSGGDAMIAWPGTITGYTLQENSSLTSTNWVDVTNAVESVSGGNNIAIVPLTGTNQFFRLALPLSQ